MEAEKVALEKWKAARDLVITTTQISTVLFAALIAAWIGMWDHLEQYRNPVASRAWTQKRNKIAEFDRRRLGNAVRGRLLQIANRIAFSSAEASDNEDGERYNKIGQEKAAKLKITAELAVADPLRTLENLTKDNDWRAPILADAISAELRYLNQSSESAGELVKHFEVKKAPAEKVPFKLLGVEFAVNGFWGWAVWMLFFSGGVLYMFLIRRAFIRHCRSCWSLLSANPPESQVDCNRDSLPLWLRPLPFREPWVGRLTNSARLDATLDPLSVLCTLLMFACAVIALSVLWIGVLSTPLLGVGSSWRLGPLLHAVALCVLFGVAIGLGAAWTSVPQDERRRGSKHTLSRWLLFLPRALWWFSRLKNPEESVEILGRRTLIVATISMTAAATLYWNPIHRALSRLLLSRPRYRKRFNIAGKRQRRHNPNISKLESGFYQDKKGQIHYVSEGGTSRSLKTPATKFDGLFDCTTLSLVHSSALVPFLRTAIVRLLRGLRHRANWEDRKQLLGNPESQRRYQQAFDLVHQGIERDREHRLMRGTMPNLQLYDLLGDIAINANSEKLLAQARAILKSAAIHTPTAFQPGRKVRSEDPSKPKHSHHCKPKHHTSWSERRKTRLQSFKSERIEERIFPTRGIPNPQALLFPPNREDVSNRMVGLLSRATWDEKLLNAETANLTHVVRSSKNRRRHNRIHRRIRVKSC